MRKGLGVSGRAPPRFYTRAVVFMVVFIRSRERDRIYIICRLLLIHTTSNVIYEVVSSFESAVIINSTRRRVGDNNK